MGKREGNGGTRGRGEKGESRKRKGRGEGRDRRGRGRKRNTGEVRGWMLGLRERGKGGEQGQELLQQHKGKGRRTWK